MIAVSPSINKLMLGDTAIISKAQLPNTHKDKEEKPMLTIITVVTTLVQIAGHSWAI
jgi:hypothetical protein